MKHLTLLIFLFLFTLLTGCAQPAGTDIPPSSSGEDGYTLQWLSGLSPQTILIQQTYEPTFSRMEAMFPFGRVAYFTLYADGTVIYIDEGETYAQQQVYSARLSLEETLALVREFMQMGFEGLQDYLDICSPPDAQGEQVCIADDSYIIVSAMLADGSFKTVKSYGSFSNDPAALEEIRQLLTGFSAPGGAPYAPEKAALFVTGLPSTMERPQFTWPLAPSYLQADTGATRATVLEGVPLRQLIDAVGRNTGEFYFENGGAGFLVYLVPWLPTDDFSADLAKEFRGIEPSSPETPGPVPEPFFLIEKAAKADLAERLNLEVGSITVYQLDQVDWPDGCLGIAIPDTACTDAIVPGFRLLLDAAGVSYEYRSNLDGSLLLPAAPELSLPEQPEAILISAPGAGSRVVSPLILEGAAAPPYEQNLIGRIVLADGQVLAQKSLTIQPEIGQGGAFRVELEFDVAGEQQAFVQVFATSVRDGGITHLSSVGVTLAASGTADILPAADGVERIRIDLPAAGERVRSGVVHVVGFALASFEQTLVVEILSDDGTVLASLPVIVQAPDWGFPGPFSADIPLTIESEGAGRIVVRDPSPAFDGDVHISSIEILLVP